MKNLFRIMGISGKDAAVTKPWSLHSKLQVIKSAWMLILITVIVGFGMLACDDGSGGDSGSGKYSGKDVLGNTYSLLIGSDARAAGKGDNFKLVVNTRGGTKNISGTVENINADGTLTLKSGTNTFTAIVDEAGNIGTVFSNNLAQSGFAPRTFDTIYLRANRWVNGADSGENWGSGTSVLVKDFPANVSELVHNQTRYKMEISGRSDVKIDNLRLEIQGLTHDDKWIFLGDTTKSKNTVIEANTPFTKTIVLDNINYFPFNVGGKDYYGNFMEYKEIILQVTNLIKLTTPANPEKNENNGTIADNDIGSIMATITDFKIKLVDSLRTPITGNLGDYIYCHKEDGLTVDYRMAMWELNTSTLTTAKKSTAKLELTLGVDLSSEPTLDLIWQDPVRGLWWQEQSRLCGGVESKGYAFELADGVTWDSGTKKLTIKLDKFIKDNRFASATAVNIVLACWYGSNQEKTNIDTFKITKAEIVE